MTEKHSPLPWVGSKDDDKIRTANDWLVAECFGHTIEEGCANAALIVRSVNGLPEAIAALEHAREHLDTDLQDKSPGWREAERIIADIDAALTKLKG